MKEVAGISGTMDAMLTSAHILGFKSKTLLKRIRLAYLGWMIDNEDHSAHECLLASKSFPALDYEIRPDFYKTIYDDTYAELVEKIYHEKYLLPKLPQETFNTCLRKNAFLPKQGGFMARIWKTLQRGS